MTTSRTVASGVLVFMLGCAAASPRIDDGAALSNTSNSVAPAPTLLSYVDARALYVFASLEPMSPDNLEQGLHVLELVSAPFLEPTPRGWFVETPGQRVRRAISEDLYGQIDTNGFRSLGIDLSQPFVVWSVGALPAARLRLGSRDKFMEYLESVAKRADTRLTRAVLEGHEYVTLPLDPSFSLAVEVKSRTLILAVVPRRDPRPTLVRALGIERPVTSLDDTDTWRDLRQRYGMNVNAFGYLDTVRSIHFLGNQLDAFHTAQNQAIWAARGKDVSTLSTCVREMSEFFAHAPRVLMGFKDADDGHARLLGVFEISDQKRALLAESALWFPGLAAASSPAEHTPLFTFSVGLDLYEILDHLYRFGDNYYRCRIKSRLADVSHRLVAYVERTYDVMVRGFTGLHITVEEQPDDAKGTHPLAGYAIVGHVKPEVFINLASPLLGAATPVTDGPPIKVPLFFLPGRPTIWISLRSEAVVVSVGRGMHQRALALLSEPAPARGDVRAVVRIGHHGARLHQLAERHSWLYPLLDAIERRAATTPDELARLRSQDASEARDYSHTTVSLLDNAIVIENVYPRHTH